MTPYEVRASSCKPTWHISQQRVTTGEGWGLVWWERSALTKIEGNNHAASSPLLHTSPGPLARPRWRSWPLTVPLHLPQLMAAALASHSPGKNMRNAALLRLPTLSTSARRWPGRPEGDLGARRLTLSYTRKRTQHPFHPRRGTTTITPLDNKLQQITWPKYQLYCNCDMSSDINNILIKTVFFLNTVQVYWKISSHKPVTSTTLLEFALPSSINDEQLWTVTPLLFCCL